MQIWGIDVGIGPEERATEHREAAVGILEAFTDVLRGHDGSLRPIRSFDEEPGTHAYHLSADYREPQELTPGLVQEHLERVKSVLVEPFAIEKDAGGMIRADSQLLAPLWWYFPHDVQSTSSGQSSVDVRLNLEGVATTDEQKQPLEEFADAAYFPEWNGNIQTDGDLHLHTRFPNGGIKSFNPRYGDQGPVIQLRKSFSGKYDALMEGRILDFYQGALVRFLAEDIPRTTKDLPCYTARAAYLAEQDKSLSLPVGLEDAVRRKSLTTELSIAYKMVHRTGTLKITS
ncbi:MAG: hypothetical protein OXR66_00940 [Candidatus Woesearchaeota archaeon]|nr:hypothetical protein [Candidatus Woesearchaeota archaeon]